MQNLTANDILKKYQESSIENVMGETPGVISAEAVILSSLLWSAGSEILKTEQAMNKKWLELRQLSETDKRADRAIKLEPEYAEYMRAKFAEKSVIELLRSLKKLLASKAEESHNNY